MHKHHLLFVIIILFMTSACMAEEQTSGFYPPLRTVWTSYASKPIKGCTAAGDTVYFADQWSYGGLELSTGKELWREDLLDTGTKRLLCDGKTLCLVTGGSKIIVCDPKNGRKLWTFLFSGTPEFVVLDRGTLFCQTKPGVLTAMDAVKRKALWSVDLKRFSSAPALSSRPARSGRSMFTATAGGDVICVDMGTGKIRWHTSLKSSAEDSMIKYLSADAQRLYLVCGNMQVVAIDIANGKRLWDHRTDSDVIKGVIAASDSIFVTTETDKCFILQAKNGARVKRLDCGSFPTVYRGHILYLLDETLAAYGFMTGTYWGWDQQREHQERHRIDEILMTLPDRVLLGSDNKIICVAQGRDEPLADQVDYLIKQLRDPNASLKTRETAFQNLARIGGEKGLAAVLAAKDTNRSILAVADFLHTKTKLSAQMKDAKGVLWGLTLSTSLGLYREWCVVQLQDEAWEKAAPTGKLEDKSPLEDWFEQFVESTEITKDSDGDGWTDLLEKRLGTNPNLTDTDGDGLTDSHDKNPLAAPRKLNEAEQVLAAVFEAYFIFDQSLLQFPVVVRLPNGMEPFEFLGYEWVVLPQSRSQLKPTNGQGVAIVSFHKTEGFYEGSAPGTSPDEVVVWNKDRTQAKVAFGVSYGPTAGSSHIVYLRKFGETWVVIEIEMTGIS